MVLSKHAVESHPKHAVGTQREREGNDIVLLFCVVVVIVFICVPDLSKCNNIPDIDTYWDFTDCVRGHVSNPPLLATTFCFAEHIGRTQDQLDHTVHHITACCTCRSRLSSFYSHVEHVDKDV